MEADEVLTIIQRKIKELQDALSFINNQTINNELDFILKGSYVLDGEIYKILQGNYEVENG